MFEHKLLYGSKGARAEPGAIDATSDIPDDDFESAYRPDADWIAGAVRRLVA